MRVGPWTSTAYVLIPGHIASNLAQLHLYYSWSWLFICWAILFLILKRVLLNLYYIIYIYILVLPEKCGVFCDCCGQKSLIMRHIFLKNAMEYAGYLCNFMRWNCGNLQKLWELAKIVGTCKNCGLMNKKMIYLPPLSCNTPGNCFARSFALIFVGKWDWFADFIMPSSRGSQLSDDIHVA